MVGWPWFRLVGWRTWCWLGGTGGQTLRQHGLITAGSSVLEPACVANGVGTLNACGEAHPGAFALALRMGAALGGATVACSKGRP
ncbi:hypothetical protein HNQ59_003127 [Chitinivorax tropicus]|uniref:Uncharacterized protein n=1 Tax=Chitinivorax tropicus TaxID=714531 RepID=A0A840MRW1_9PROT|nr:hypothetical protein [Chitinivorax tropicus]MBB5019819.1 hypothetical protein [Chitinivorax tropicus]